MVSTLIDFTKELLGPAAVLAGGSWILRSYISRSFDKDLEKYKKELEIENHKLREQFSAVYLKKTSVFEELFVKAMNSVELVWSSLYRNRGNNEELILEQLAKAGDGLTEYYKFKNRKVLFLNTEVNKEAGDLHVTLNETIELFWRLSEGVEKYNEIKDPEKWDSEANKYQERLGSCLARLREAIHKDLEM